MRNKPVLFLVQGALIAALYVALTHLANLMGLANYAIQVRFSEALTILPLFTPAAIPGLFIGCLITNLTTGCAILDIIFGSLATLIGAVATYCIGRTLEAKVPCPLLRVLGAIPPILANMIAVPPILIYVYEMEGAYLFFVATVGLGEVISCGILGYLLHLALTPHRAKLFGPGSVRTSGKKQTN